MSAAAAPAAVLTAAARLAWRGADVVVTVSADDPAVLARRLARALAAFGAAVELEPAHVEPQRQAARVYANAQTLEAAPPAPAFCATHGQPLTWRTPKGGGPGWYSHRTAEGGWCRG